MRREKLVEQVTKEFVQIKLSGNFESFEDMNERLQREASQEIEREIADDNANDFNEISATENKDAKKKAKERQSKLLMKAADSRAKAMKEQQKRNKKKNLDKRKRKKEEKKRAKEGKKRKDSTDSDEEKRLKNLTQSQEVDRQTIVPSQNEERVHANIINTSTKRANIAQEDEDLINEELSYL